MPLARRPGDRLLLDELGHEQYWIGLGSASGEGEQRLRYEDALAAVRRATMLGRVQISRIHQLLIWFGRTSPTGLGHFEQERLLATALQRGELSVFVRHRSVPKYQHQYLYERASPPTPPPQDPLGVSETSLLITRCDAELGDGPLRFSYLLRNLAGRPVELRIHASGLADPIVHRRLLAPAETLDGRHDATWDGRVSVPGPLFERRLWPQHSPCLVELFADATYRDEAPFSIAKARVVIVEFGERSFAPAHVVLLPDVEPRVDHQPGRVQPSGLAAIEAVLRHAHANSDATLLALGHADGDEKLTLAEARAENVQRYLAGDRSGWAAHCVAHYHIADQQRVLAWIARRFPEFNCDPGPVDNDIGPRTRAAQANFRTAYAKLVGEELPSDDALGVADWRAFNALYDRAVAELLGATLDLDQQRARLRFCEPARLGLGASFANDRPGAEGADRRVDLAFIDEAELQYAEDQSGDWLYGASPAASRDYLRFEDGVEQRALSVRVVEDDGRPVANLALELEPVDASVRELVTGRGGEARFEGVHAGPCNLRLLQAAELDWPQDAYDGTSAAVRVDERVHEISATLLELERELIELDSDVDSCIIIARPTLHLIVPDVLRCDHDSALLVPAPWTNERHPLAAIVHALVAMLDDPKLWLAVVGHASASGSDASNQALSERRAGSIRAIVEDDGAAWVAHARERGSLRDVVAYIDYLGRRRGWACPVDTPVAELGTDETSTTRAAVSAFQAEYNARFAENLDVDGVCGNQTLAAIFAVLHDEFERWLAKLGAKPDQLPLERVVYGGYGSTLAGRRETAADAEAADRVVDLILIEGVEFEPSIEPAALYTGKLARRRQFCLPDEPDEWATGPFTIVSDLTPVEPVQPETYQLNAEDGTWTVERVLPDDGQVEAGELVLHFPALPTDLRYTLVVISDGGNRSVIFEDIAYGDLHRVAPASSLRSPHA